MKKVKQCGYPSVILLVSLLLFLLGGFLSITFAAGEDFPKKEITIIVNFGPGGARDILARGVGNTMSKYLGVPVVVMNMPGAGGARGIIQLYHSPPDGYTIGVGMATDIFNQVLEKHTFDCKKFSYIGRAQHSSPIYFVKPDSPFRSVKDFKTFGKPVRHSTFSLLSNATVPFMVIANREGWPLVIVGGYKSAAEAGLALIRGEVEFTSLASNAGLQFVQAGQMRPILTLDEKRHPDYPDTPTVGELGHADMAVFANNLWFMAPPEVPIPRMQILEDALMKTLKDPEFLKWAKGAGVDPGPLSGEETKRMILNLFPLIEQYKEDIERYLKK